MRKIAVTSLFCILFLGLFITSGLAQTEYTPTAYKVTVYKTDISTNGTTFVNVFDNVSGTQIDLVDQASLSSAFGSGSVPAGTYGVMRMVVGTLLVYSSTALSITDGEYTVTGMPPGPYPGTMEVYFATAENGGLPPDMGSGTGGQGTSASPFLMPMPFTVAAGGNTSIRLIFSVTDTLVDYGSWIDLMPPGLFVVASNASASTLSGAYNVSYYNANKELDWSGGPPPIIDEWDFSSGWGTLTFDGDGTWDFTGTENNQDVLGSTSAMTLSPVSGLYGVNTDGSIWMVVDGEDGTIWGALQNDGEVFVGTMIDSDTSHFMIYGVKQATTAGNSTFNGDYYYAGYRDEYYDDPFSMVEYLTYAGDFSSATFDGSGGVSGSSDENSVQVDNPTERYGGPPSSLFGPTTSLGNPFANTYSVSPNGTFTMLSGGGVGGVGGVLESGNAGCYAADSEGSPIQEFGFAVKKSAPGTFTNTSLTGTYFGAYFGDWYDAGTFNSYFFSGSFSVTFDGAGNGVVTTMENQEGVLTVNTFPIVYSVDSATGLVDMGDGIMGAIGVDGKNCVLYSSAEFPTPGAPNEQRFLGLAVKQ